MGPLGQGACHEVQLKMLGLKVGVCKLEAVRVVDLGRELQQQQEGGSGGGGVGSGSGVVDIRGEMLPEVVIIEAVEEGDGAK